MDAFKLIERIDDIVDGRLLVPCIVETDMPAGFLPLDHLYLIVSGNIAQNGCQLGILVDDGGCLRLLPGNCLRSSLPALAPDLRLLRGCG